MRWEHGALRVAFPSASSAHKHALGKFELRGETRFEVMPDGRIESRPTCSLNDRYDRDPARDGGLRPHRHPHALEQRGRAQSYDITGRWREDAFVTDR